MGLCGADDHCGRLGMTLMFMFDADSQVCSPFKLFASSSPSSVWCIRGCFHTAWAKMREYTVSSSLCKTYWCRSASGTAPLWCVQRSILDQYSLDNLTSAFNSVCPYLCFVSWLLIKRTPQDLTCRGRTQWWLGLQTQALVSLAIDPLSPHLSLPLISVSPPVMVLLSISNKKTSLFGGWAWNRHRQLKLQLRWHWKIMGWTSPSESNLSLIMCWTLMLMNSVRKSEKQSPEAQR